MSRIHEALKKAEQDRAVGQTLEIAKPPDVVSVEAPVTVVTESEAAAPTVVPRATEAASVVNVALEDRTGFEDLKAHCMQPHWRPDPAQNVFSNPEASAYAAEQFRTLRSRLYQLRANQTLRTILITSAIPKEGKTWVTSNLAQAIVRQVDRRALIIDADLRAPRLHIPLGAPSTPGLSEYLMGEADQKAVIQRSAEGNLFFVASGKEVPNPSELLSHGRMRELLEQVSPMFDWVLLDSPPCLSVADAGILAGMCDGVLVVMRAGQTPSDLAEKVRQDLRERNVIGIVLNGVTDVPHYSSAYHYGYGNGNGSGQGIAKESAK